MVEKEWMEGYDPVASGEQDENGVDLVALRQNLSLTIDERWEQYVVSAGQMLKLIDASERAGFRSRGSQSR